MTETLPTPLERLHLREVLQDRWCDEVRRITELSVELHTALDDKDDGNPDPVDVAIAISDSRLRLAEIEQAMGRLDDRSYGRCFACQLPVPFASLIQEPEARYCAQCRRSAAKTVTIPAIA